ncbi:MAG: hypothetical protein RKR03_20200 [Candidatus Competibacter sp.]|nr:hypothetical protein [Candidatus Competibacter sp.]
MMNPADPILVLRNALAELTPASSHDATTPPAQNQIYAPAGHETTLDPDRSLVIGGRGVGKSFWSAVLLNDPVRNYVANSYPRLALDRCEVALGFAGVDVDAHQAPSREVLDELIERDGYAPEKVWRAVILGVVNRALKLGLPDRLGGHAGLVAWVDSNAERTQQTLRHADDRLQESGRRLIVLFDALDRVGQQWQAIRQRTRALLQVALAMRSYRAIKLKLFLRVDQAEDPDIVAFADASKLIGAKVDLLWERHDLYGLLYTLLLNDSEAGEVFAALIERATGLQLPPAGGPMLPAELKTSEPKQEAVFIALAGPYMGSDTRRGKTFTWLYNHLADGFGRVSPRSFLEALRHAARYPLAESRLVLHPKGLQSGVQGASELRLGQLKEEYGWIETVIEPLADLNVPCNAMELFDRWRQARTIESIAAAGGEARREPVEFHEMPEDRLAALLKALMRIGVAERRADSRINVPDIYRVAAKLLRRGGVKPRR